MNIFVTGASSKIGRKLIPQLLLEGHCVRALKYRRNIDIPGVEEVQGSLCDEEFVHRALQDIDIVIHLASSKEDKENFMSSGMKGLYFLLDEMRQNRGVRHFIQAGADASFGIYFYERKEPITETMPFEAYPGVYPLSKVLEETICSQMRIMYDIPVTVLRFSWIIDQDDLLSHMTLADPGFGIPVWREYGDPGLDNAACELIHPDGSTGVRHVVDIDDVVQSIMLAMDNPISIGRAYNIAAPEAFRYDELAAYVGKKLDIPVARFTVPEFHDFRMSIERARNELGYCPRYSAFDMIDKAIMFRQSGGERIESAYKG